jgi:hypothetical protein
VIAGRYCRLFVKIVGWATEAEFTGFINKALEKFLLPAVHSLSGRGILSRE